jgi:hypothetical protein
MQVSSRPAILQLPLAGRQRGSIGRRDALLRCSFAASWDMAASPPGATAGAGAGGIVARSVESGTTLRMGRSASMHVASMHGALGVVLGVMASLPARELVVTVAIAALFGVGSGITGFILSKIENSA